MLLRIRKGLSLLVCLAIAITFVFPLSSCRNQAAPHGSDSEEDRGADSGKISSPDENAESNTAPPERDFGRNTVSFYDMPYVRPDMGAFAERIEAVSQSIREADSTEEARAAFLTLKEDLDTIETMLSLATIRQTTIDANGYYRAERDYILENTPAVAQKAAELLDAAEAREDGQALLADPFCARWNRKFADARVPNETMRILRDREEYWLSMYRSLSPATVRITSRGITDTYEALRREAEQTYGPGTQAFRQADTLMRALYLEERTASRRWIYTELVKVRRQIADEYGAKSYAKIAYSSPDTGHDYTPEQFSQYLEIVRDYVLPVYEKLENDLFRPFLSINNAKNSADYAIDARRLVNRICEQLEERDEHLSEAFCFLLQYGLYDTFSPSERRGEDAVVFYIPRYNAPYLSFPVNGDLGDFLLAAKGFGKFLDYYVNGTAEVSDELSGVYADALSLLTLLDLEGKISAEHFTYLKFTALKSALEDVIENALYGKFEELVYALPYEEINDEKINECFGRAAEFFRFNADAMSDFAKFLSDRIVEEPCTEQGKSVSMIVSLDLFLGATKDLPAGYEQYKGIVARDCHCPALSKALEEANLISPLNRDAVRDLCDGIHFYLMGAHFYQELQDPVKT